MTLGNPQPDPNQKDLILSKKQSPITFRLEGNTLTETNLDFDLDGNVLLYNIKDLLLEGKKLEILFEDSLNFQSNQELLMSCLSFGLKAHKMSLEIVQSIYLNSEKDISLVSKEINILSPEIKLGYPNKDILDLENEEYDLNIGYDFILTRKKLIKFLENIIKPFVEEVQTLEEKFNSHTNGGQTLDAIFKLTDQSGSNAAKEYESLQGSKTTKSL